MKHGSLFSGIGGFDLAAEWMGWENVFHCEWNEFGKKVLKHYWPNAESFHDITKTDFTKYANQIDILTGGFPCQPYSAAGKRLGKEDERHLWPEMLRALREIAPRYVVGENVRGLTNWNGGLVFDEVCSDLENLGYQVAPFIIPASATNAPHQRERIWFVAYRNGNGFNQCQSKYEKLSGQTGFDAFNDLTINDENGNVTDSRCKRLQSATYTRNIRGLSTEEIIGGDSSSQAIEPVGNEWRTRRSSRWHSFPTQPPVCGGNDGLSRELDGITFPKWRAESIKAYGNAIVPQVVYEIFKAIEKYENL
jgi:DNA (cytosine-5)-methyltransferase 1